MTKLLSTSTPSHIQLRKNYWTSKTLRLRNYPSLRIAVRMVIDWIRLFQYFLLILVGTQSAGSKIAKKCTQCGKLYDASRVKCSKPCYAILVSTPTMEKDPVDINMTKKRKLPAASRSVLLVCVVLFFSL